MKMRRLNVDEVDADVSGRPRQYQRVNATGSSSRTRDERRGWTSKVRKASRKPTTMIDADESQDREEWGDSDDEVDVEVVVVVVDR